MVRIRNLTRVFTQNKIVLQNVNLHIELCKKVAIVGANGSGKTTLLRIIAGLTAPTSGDVIIKGEKQSIQNQGLKKCVSWVPSTDGSFLPRLTGLENLMYFGVLRSIEKAKLLEALEPWREVKMVSQALDTPFAICSSGMRQVLNLLRGILGGAELLVLDEPLRSLDQEIQKLFWMQLKSHHPNMTAILSAHLPPDATVVDSIHRLENGSF